MGVKELELAIRDAQAGSLPIDMKGPREEQVVEAAEARLGLRFPPSYRDFLRRFGCGWIGSIGIYGIIDANFDNASVPNGIWLTLHQRHMANVPNSIVIVSDTGYGTWYAIDTHKGDDLGECPVVEFSPFDGSFELVANDFGTFLLQRVRAIVSSD